MKRMLFCQLMFLSAFLCAKALYAQERRVGVDRFRTDSNVFDHLGHPAAFVLQSALTGRLLREGAGDTQIPDVASGFTYFPDRSMLSLVIDARTRFTNLTSIQRADVEFSLKRCGIDFKTYNLHVLRNFSGAVEIRMNSDPSTLPQFLTTCPILERETALLFGDDFGRGTNVIGAGPYAVRETRRGRHMVLEYKNLRSIELREPVPHKIHLLSTESNERALAQLRGAELDMFFVENQDVMAEVRKDETLVLQKCSIYNVVLRRGLALRCDPYMDLLHLNYDYELPRYRKLSTTEPSGEH